jgi:hypothetical protein
MSLSSFFVNAVSINAWRVLRHVMACKLGVPSSKVLILSYGAAGFDVVPVSTADAINAPIIPEAPCTSSTSGGRLLGISTVEDGATIPRRLDGGSGNGDSSSSSVSLSVPSSLDDISALSSDITTIVAPFVQTAYVDNPATTVDPSQSTVELVLPSTYIDSTFTAAGTAQLKRLLTLDPATDIGYPGQVSLHEAFYPFTLVAGSSAPISLASFTIALASDRFIQQTLVIALYSADSLQPGGSQVAIAAATLSVSLGPCLEYYSLLLPSTFSVTPSSSTQDFVLVVNAAQGSTPAPVYVGQSISTSSDGSTIMSVTGVVAGQPAPAFRLANLPEVPAPDPASLCAVVPQLTSPAVLSSGAGQPKGIRFNWPLPAAGAAALTSFSFATVATTTFTATIKYDLYYINNLISSTTASATVQSCVSYVTTNFGNAFSSACSAANVDCSVGASWSIALTVSGYPDPAAVVYILPNIATTDTNPSDIFLFGLSAVYGGSTVTLPNSASPQLFTVRAVYANGPLAVPAAMISSQCPPIIYDSTVGTAAALSASPSSHNIGSGGSYVWYAFQLPAMAPLSFSSVDLGLIASASGYAALNVQLFTASAAGTPLALVAASSATVLLSPCATYYHVAFAGVSIGSVTSASNYVISANLTGTQMTVLVASPSSSIPPIQVGSTVSPNPWTAGVLRRPSSPFALRLAAAPVAIAPSTTCGTQVYLDNTRLTAGADLLRDGYSIPLSQSSGSLFFFAAKSATLSSFDFGALASYSGSSATATIQVTLLQSDNTGLRSPTDVNSAPVVQTSMTLTNVPIQLCGFYYHFSLTNNFAVTAGLYYVLQVTATQFSSTSVEFSWLSASLGSDSPAPPTQLTLQPLGMFSTNLITGSSRALTLPNGVTPKYFSLRLATAPVPSTFTLSSCPTSASLTITSGSCAVSNIPWLFRDASAATGNSGAGIPVILGAGLTRSPACHLKASVTIT